MPASIDSATVYLVFIAALLPGNATMGRLMSDWALNERILGHYSDLVVPI
jgi:hypothetical protein